MKTSELVLKEKEQQNKMESYYSFQSKIYDLTRWTFLFGRNTLIKKLPTLPEDSVILEVGCGTGYNLNKLARKYPNSTVYGLDASAVMLNKARKKTQDQKQIQVLHETYGTPSTNRPSQVDLIVFSYSLSMINPQWKELLETALKELKPGGYIAVTDFQKSRFGWFKKHMANNHVRMDDHLLPVLENHHDSITNISKAAYLGIWNYFVYVGSPKSN